MNQSFSSTLADSTKLEQEDFSFSPLGAAHLPDLLGLQSTVLQELGELPWLRQNTAEGFATCLSAEGPHASLGVFKDGALVAAAILYDGGVGDESIKGYFTDDEAQMRATLNLKLVLTHPAYRRHRLGSQLLAALRQRAVESGRAEILCTIHEENLPSQGLFKKLGYKLTGRVKTKYGPRLVFGQQLSVA